MRGQKKRGLAYLHRERLFGSEAAVSIDTARKNDRFVSEHRTTRILDEEEGFTLMNNVQRHLEDEYAWPLDIKLEKLSYDNVFSCVRMKVKKEQENFVAKNYVLHCGSLHKPETRTTFCNNRQGIPVGFIMFAHSKGSAPCQYLAVHDRPAVSGARSTAARRCRPA